MNHFLFHEAILPVLVAWSNQSLGQNKNSFAHLRTKAPIPSDSVGKTALTIYYHLVKIDDVKDCATLPDKPSN